VESVAENDINGDREIDVAQRPPLSVEAVLGSGGQAIVTQEERNGQMVAVKHVRHFYGFSGPLCEQFQKWRNLITIYIIRVE